MKEKIEELKGEFDRLFVDKHSEEVYINNKINRKLNLLVRCGLLRKLKKGYINSNKIMDIQENRDIIVDVHEKSLREGYKKGKQETKKKINKLEKTRDLLIEENNKLRNKIKQLEGGKGEK